MVNSYFDRTAPSVRFSPSWEQTMVDGGKNLGEQALAAEHPAIVEFWNEPYLNWANDNRKNFDPKFYDVNKATEGGPVHIKHDGTLVPHLKWTKQRSA